jgi:hypothetical protein
VSQLRSLGQHSHPDSEHQVTLLVPKNLALASMMALVTNECPDVLRGANRVIQSQSQASVFLPKTLSTTHAILERATPPVPGAGRELRPLFYLREKFIVRPPIRIMLGKLGNEPNTAACLVIPWLRVL